MDRDWEALAKEAILLADKHELWESVGNRPRARDLLSILAGKVYDEACAKRYRREDRRRARVNAEGLKGEGL